MAIFPEVSATIFVSEIWRVLLLLLLLETFVEENVPPPSVDRAT